VSHDQIKDLEIEVKKLKLDNAKKGSEIEGFKDRLELFDEVKGQRDQLVS
jgi:hypothetical protein